MNFPLPDIRAAGNLSGKRIFLRVDFNVPVKDGVVVDDFRIRRVLQTIRFLTDNKAKVILGSHIGRDPLETLRPVFEYLQNEIKISFAESVSGAKTLAAVKNLKEGGVLLLQNLRSDKGESANTTAFAKTLASYADIYVNDAFSVSHRASASNVGVPKLLPHYAGMQFIQEVRSLSSSFAPEKPSLCILGGAKFETKTPLIKKFLPLYDTVFVAGAIANDFFKAKGYEVGESLVSSGASGVKDLGGRKNLLLPVDVVVETEKGMRKVRDPRAVEPADAIRDVGPKTIELLKKRIADARFILWNGTLGVYEHGFTKGTEEIAKAIGRSKAAAVIGGGDTVASVDRLGLESKSLFLSTGGGAMLEYLSEGTLPGIEALRT